jgi:hypothetical protein
MALTRIDSSVLSTTGVSAGTYGSTTQIPTIVIGADGRITLASNTAVSTTINLSGTSGSGSVAGGGTLSLTGSNGVTTTVSSSTITISTPQNLQTNASPSFASISTTGDVNISGNLTVSGAYTYTNTAIFQSVDSLIELAANNTGDAIDIGFYGQYSSSNYAGLVRSAGGNFVLFKGVAAPSSNAFGTISLANTATLKANITGGTVSSLASAIGIGDGGTGATSFTSGNVVIYNGTSLASLANTTTSVTGGLSSTNTITSLTVDGYGRITAYTAAAIGTLNQNTSGSAATFTSTSQNSQFNSVGVGTAASTTAGEIRATNNITAYYSDDRLKNKLGPILNALSKVKSLNGFYYEANQTAQDLGYDAIREVGVSAQEVQAIMPEIVVPAPISDKYLTVRYEKLIPLLVEAIKELSEEVERLKESK